MDFKKQYKAIIEEGNDVSKKEKALEVKNLKISFKTDNGKVQAVRGVSFDLYRGETLCIVGESGSGKSVTSKAIMGILSPNALVEGGSIMYQGEDLLQVSEEEFIRIRGKKIGMIFQDPLSSLNPIVRIGKQITETMLINSDMERAHYEELIATELVAYKNAAAVRDAAIRLAQNRYNDLSSALKREIASALEAGDKAKAAALKSSSKEQLKELAKERTEKIAAAKKRYQNVAPGLKSALEARKKVAKRETAAWKRGLKTQRDEKIAAAKARCAALYPSVDWAAAKKLDGEIRRLKLCYGLRHYALYFFRKRRDAVEARKQQRLAPLLEQRQALSKDFDAAGAEIRQAKIAYQNAIRITRAEAKRRALKVMKEVGIPQAERRFRQFPFEFSGGMRQRIVIAIALTANPDILICDEPTTALDVTIQAQILELINKLKVERNMSVIFITHDLGVVANMADRVAVMYAGKICEYGTDKEIFFDPHHPYTWALLSSIPDIDSKEKLEAIPGTPPDMIYPPEGDAFAARNKYALGIDYKHQPPFFQLSPTHFVASWLEYPGAQRVEPPKIVSQRIKKALEEETSYEK